MPWKKGQSGNPSGRPRKGQTLTELMEEIGDRKGTNGIELRREVVEKIFELARLGDLAACRLILEYLDGKPVERIQAEVGPAVHFTSDDAAAAMAELRAWEEAKGLEPGSTIIGA